MISRLSRRSLFRTVMPPSCRLGVLRASATGLLRRDDVDDEVEGAVGRDLVLLLRAVAEVRRDLEQHPAADLEALEPVGPALDDALQRELDRLGRVALVEGLVRAVDRAQVVDLDRRVGGDG